jgi:hypothetical protein
MDGSLRAGNRRRPQILEHPFDWLVFGTISAWLIREAA